MAEAPQEYEVEIAANIDGCIEVLTDFEQYPVWSSPILEAKILTQHPDGRAHHVGFALDMRIRTLRYTLAYEYDLPSQISWSLLEGDLTNVSGSYRLEGTPQGHVIATCRQEIDLGFWVPGAIRRMAERQALRDSVLEFKTQAEQKHGLA
ncbi:MAG: SRPBCC family protein [Candidatus Binatia bacterium]|nr:SRPBCC family protein [Candidatus Binatia bacterium]